MSIDAARERVPAVAVVVRTVGLHASAFFVGRDGFRGFRQHTLKV